MPKDKENSSTMEALIIKNSAENAQISHKVLITKDDEVEETMAWMRGKSDGIEIQIIMQKYLNQLTKKFQQTKFSRRRKSLECAKVAFRLVTSVKKSFVNVKC